MLQTQDPRPAVVKALEFLVSGIEVGASPKPELIVKPQPGPQTLFFECEADIVFYGGAAGGGKSWGLINLPIYKGWHQVEGFTGMIFRRTYAMAEKPGATWDQVKDAYRPHSADFAGMTAKFPRSKIAVGHLQHEANKYDHQGAEYAYIAFDELPHFTSGQFWYMVSRNRSTCGVKPVVRAGMNPEPDSWVLDLVSWWIDDDESSPSYGLPIPERSGVVRYLVRERDEIIWGDSREELKARGFDEGNILSFSFIPAKLEDNKILEQKDPKYRANLNAQPLAERKKLLEGNWKFRAEAGTFFKRHWFPILNAVPTDIVKVVRYWDRAATEPSEQNRDPDWTMGMLLGLRQDRSMVILDVQMDRLSPSGVEKMIRNTTEQDVADWGAKFTCWQQTDPGQAGKVEASNLSKALMGLPVFFDPVPTTSKEARALASSAQAEQGNISMVKGTWNGPVLNQLVAFPTKGIHDEAPDTLSGGQSKLAQVKPQPRARGYTNYA